MLRTKGLYYPSGSSPYIVMTKYIKLCTLKERKVFGLVGHKWMLSSLWSCGCWLMVLFLLGLSTLTCVHLWLWWHLLYGVYLPNHLLKTIGPYIVMVALCFVKRPLTRLWFKGPLTHLWFWTIYFMLDLWTFTLWLYYKFIK